MFVPKAQNVDLQDFFQSPDRTIGTAKGSERSGSHFAIPSDRRFAL